MLLADGSAAVLVLRCRANRLGVLRLRVRIAPQHPGRGKRMARCLVPGWRIRGHRFRRVGLHRFAGERPERGGPIGRHLRQRQHKKPAGLRQRLAQRRLDLVSLPASRAQQQVRGRELLPCNPVGFLDQHRGVHRSGPRGQSLFSHRHCRWREFRFQPGADRRSGWQSAAGG